MPPLFAKRVPLLVRASGAPPLPLPDAQNAPAAPFAARVSAQLAPARGSFGPTAAPAHLPPSPASPAPSPASVPPPDAPCVEHRHPGITVTMALSERGQMLAAGDSPLSYPAKPFAKTLTITLTDDDNPFFLHVAEIGDDDYQLLRAQQNLLVDFSQFPYKVIELFELCLGEAREAYPKFTAQLATDHSSRQSTLSIVESNSFRNIVHVALQMTPATDAMLKQFLADSIRDYKRQLASMQSELASSRARLSTSIEESGSVASRLTRDLDRERAEHAEQVAALRAAHADQIERERDERAREREAARRERERDREEAEARVEGQACLFLADLAPGKLTPFALQIKSLTTRLSSLTADLAAASSRAALLDASLASTQKQLDGALADLAAAQADADRYQAEARRAVRERQETAEELESAREKARALQARLGEAVEAVRGSEGVAGTATEEKTQLAAALAAEKVRCARLEEDLAVRTQEVSKANDIIRRLQADLRATKTKTKTRNTAIVQQERALEEREEEVRALKEEVEELRSKLDAAEESRRRAKGKVADLEGQLEQAKRQLDDKSNVIAWLHKRSAGGDPGLKERTANRVGGLAHSAGTENVQPTLGAGMGLDQRYVPRFLD
ncbi:hypothetical protein DFJ74DRAFT_767928 [Hyaloraphidium curvatum]|nr:hypothetical protein DFJ74DRAFT_767928 [Hyaloraphidium curvatum]